MGGLEKKTTKSLPVSKRMVYDSYLKVIKNGGGAGIDKESIEKFNERQSNNLFKIWNRMASGSYYPPALRTVFIPKKQGGLRPLGIPTVGDRIAQGVVKDYLEPILEPVFHNSSYGYRPGRSAHHAIVQCEENCKKYGWVVDVDIKGFFDNINHGMLMQLVRHHTGEKFVLLYVERWLKAGVEQEDGSIVGRTKGTPQGGVISPLLANLYLHHAFDKWMQKEYPQCPFERYADDIVIHCNSKEESAQLLELLKERMSKAELTLHPEKTKIVFCKNYKRPGNDDKESFTFLGYSFQPRTKKDFYGRKKTYLSFSGAISREAKTRIREVVRTIVHPKRMMNDIGIISTCVDLNPKIIGWVNYYAKLNKDETLKVFYYVNTLMKLSMKYIYKLKSQDAIDKAYKQLQKEYPRLLHHWRLGIK